jgi:hydrogenase maturation protein HypF
VRTVTIAVRGVVQGVGFRPFVYRTARVLGLRGTVSNNSAGVMIHAQGPDAAIDGLLEALRTRHPPLAVVRECVVGDTTTLTDLPEFTIVASSQGESVQVDAARDTATCDACVREMRDPNNRRYRHAFINCTDCGPRFSIIRELPYDRPATTMAGFGMCPRCGQEYRDPSDRRFHAQPVCCPACGPRLQVFDADGTEIACDDPVAHAVAALERGSIVAIKGLGGFHLACRADRQEPVETLRRRKHREEKPLAIMVRDLSAARAVCRVSEADAALLRSPECPIVLLPRRSDCDTVAQAVAPTVTTLGVMLPYTPLHHLLSENAAYPALVMTSGNRSGEPILSDNQAALQALKSIADMFLVHDRAIYVAVDDSIVRSLSVGPVVLRRARGYVPSPIFTGRPVDGIVGLGGILKSTVCVGRGEAAYVSQYLGTVDNVETIERCAGVLQHLSGLLGVRPRLLVRDLHPGGFMADTVDLHLPVVSVQHHHAHAVACMVENGVRGPAICVVYDGTGLGDDGTVWGGEILLVSETGYERLGHLRPIPLPGGDAATRHPGRFALSAAMEALGVSADRCCTWLPPGEQQAVTAMLAAGVNCPLTSSAGRLFDAVAAVLGVCREQTYEAQAAIELEAMAAQGVSDAYEWSTQTRDGRLIMDGASLVASVVDDATRGTDPGVISARFHNTLAAMTVETVQRAARARGVMDVCLSGGCFQNALLFERVLTGLRDSGLNVYHHRVLSPGDECVALGQVVIAAKGQGA